MEIDGEKSEVPVADEIKVIYEPKKLNCFGCPETFEQPDELSKHIRKLHIKDENSFECDECEEIFLSEVNLKEHKEIHTDPSANETAEANETDTPENISEQEFDSDKIIVKSENNLENEVYNVPNDIGSNLFEAATPSELESKEIDSDDDSIDSGSELFEPNSASNSDVASKSTDNDDISEVDSESIDSGDISKSSDSLEHISENIDSAENCDLSEATDSVEHSDISENTDSVGHGDLPQDKANDSIKYNDISKVINSVENIDSIEHAYMSVENGDISNGIVSVEHSDIFKSIDSVEHSDIFKSIDSVEHSDILKDIESMERSDKLKIFDLVEQNFVYDNNPLEDTNIEINAPDKDSGNESGLSDNKRLSDSNILEEDIADPEGENFFTALDDDHDDYESSENIISTDVNDINVDETIWVYNDETLPKGWAIKQVASGSGKIYKYFKAPNGTIFKGRKPAYMHMSESGLYSEDDLELMRNTLKIKWTTPVSDSHVPKGWKIRKTRGKKSDGTISLTYWFLTPEGHIFKTQQTAIDHMRKDGRYTDLDIERIKNIEQFGISRNIFASIIKNVHAEIIENTQDETTKNIKNNHLDWCDDEDPTVPVGWKTRTTQTKNMHGSFSTIHWFLSPTGQIFKSRKKAVSYMVETEGYTEEDIKQMKSGIISKPQPDIVWTNEDTTIPSGWKSRTSELVDSNGKMRKTQYFLTDRGNVLKGRQAALQYLLNNKKITKEELRNFKSVPIKTVKSNRDWNTHDPSIPKGWKSDIDNMETFGKTTQIKRYSAPDGKYCLTRVDALNYMMKEGIFSNEDIDKMKSGLHEEGWETAGHLPKGWHFRPVKYDKPGRFNYISDDFNYFKSTKAAREFMRSSDKYDSTVIDTFNHKLNKVSPKANKEEVDSKYEWLYDGSLPEGWKFRMSENENTKVIKNYYRSPEGIVFKNIIQALEYMSKKNYNQFDIDLTVEKLMEDGWERNEKLPKGWLIKITENKKSRYGNKHKEKTYMYLSQDFQLFTTNGAAVNYMKESLKYEQTEIDNLNSIFIEQQKKLQVKRHNWVDGDDTIPGGWKQRTVNFLSGSENKERTFLMAPDGSTFPSTRKALQHMIKEEYFEEDINIMVTKLETEGWEKSDTIPVGWFRKQNKTSKNVVYLTNKFTFLKTSRNVINFIQMSGDEYSDFDISKLEINLKRDSSASTKVKCEKDDVTDAEKQSKKTDIINQRDLNKKYDWNRGDGKLPEGWKMRTFESTNPSWGTNTRIMTYYLNPNGISMQLIQALQFMIKEYYSESDMQMMISRLPNEGWVTNSNLPDGWHTKMFSIQHPKPYYLTPKFEIIQSKKSLIEHMKADGSYITKDIERISEMSRQDIGEQIISSKFLNLDQDQKPHIGLPKSGNLEQDPESQYDMPYSGNLDMEEEEQFETAKSDVYDEDEEEQIEMSSSIGVAQVNERPDNLNPGEKQIPEASKLNPLDRDEPTGNSDDEIDDQDDDWSKMSGILPNGWKMSSTKSSSGVNLQYFITSHGIRLSGAVQALQFMVKEKYAPILIQMMSKHLRGEGWKPNDKYMPKGWFTKPIKNGKSGAKRYYLTPKFVLLKSSKKALDFMKSDSTYTQEDLYKFRSRKHIGDLGNSSKNVYNIETRIAFNIETPPKIEEVINKPEVIHKPSAKIDEVMPKDDDSKHKLINKYNWEDENGSLPYGWKVRTIKVGNTDKKLTYFLSPDGIMLNGLIQLVQHMVKEKYSQNDFKLISKRLQEEDWTPNDKAPDGWLVKDKKFSSNGCTLYLTQNFQLLKSTKAAVEFVRNNESYSNEDVQRLQNIKSTEKEVNLNLQNIKTTENEANLNVKTESSEGYEYRETTGNKRELKIIVENNQKFSIKTEILNDVELKEQKISSKLVEENQQKSTKFDGWSPANNILPNGWLQKTIYMSPNNIEFGDLKSVLNFMQQDQSYTDHDIAKVKNQVGKKSEVVQPIGKKSEVAQPIGKKSAVVQPMKNNPISDADLTDFNTKVKNIVYKSAAKKRKSDDNIPIDPSKKQKSFEKVAIKSEPIAQDGYSDPFLKYPNTLHQNETNLTSMDISSIPTIKSEPTYFGSNDFSFAPNSPSTMQSTPLPNKESQIKSLQNKIKSIKDKIHIPNNGEKIEPKNMETKLFDQSFEPMEFKKTDEPKTYFNAFKNYLG